MKLTNADAEQRMKDLSGDKDFVGAAMADRIAAA